MEQSYLDILKTLGTEQPRGFNDHIMLVDGLNTLIRSFATNVTINSKGHNVGGLTGFLKSLGASYRLINPTRIIVVWDGQNGAQNRKNLDPNYKAQRIHSSIIHGNVYENKVEELDSLHEQSTRLVDYLSLLPVTYVKIDKLEADDVIAYLARMASRRGKKVTILSSDRDFLQLIDANISVYSPVKKILYDYNAAYEYLQVLPENYNIVKALIGDDSDNIAGVKGVGIKTILSIFPKMAEDLCDLQYIYDTCAENLGRKKIYAKIINDWDRVERNFKIMDLNSTVLSSTEKAEVARILKEPLPKLQVGSFMLLLEQDQIDNIVQDTERWLMQFLRLQNFS